MITRSQPAPHDREVAPFGGVPGFDHTMARWQARGGGSRNFQSGILLSAIFLVGTVAFSSEIAIPLDFTAEHAEERGGLKWSRNSAPFAPGLRRCFADRGDESLDFVMVSWMHNTATDVNGINRTYNHREHRGTQRIDLKTLCSLCPLWLNPVVFTACVGSIRPQHKSLGFQTVPSWWNSQRRIAK